MQDRASPYADRYNLITNCLIINVKKAEHSDAARSTSRDKIPSLKLVKHERHNPVNDYIAASFLRNKIVQLLQRPPIIVP